MHFILELHLQDAIDDMQVQAHVQKMGNEYTRWDRKKAQIASAAHKLAVNEVLRVTLHHCTFQVKRNLYLHSSNTWAMLSLWASSTTLEHTNTAYKSAWHS